MATDFTLPELGENVTTGDVLRVLVKPGDALAKDQPVLELETDKATIEVPSSVAGQVKDVKVKAGDTVKVGQAILTVEDGQTTRAAEPVGEAQPTKAVAANTAQKVPDDGGLEQHVEGEQRKSGADKPGTKRTPATDTEETQPKSSRRREEQGEAAHEERSRSAESSKPAEDAQAPKPAEAAQARKPAEDAQARGQKVVDISRGARAAAEQPAPEVPPAPAAPSVRRMARELGVDINEVPGSGPGGRISIDDVKAHAKRLVTGAARGGAAAAEPLPDFTRWGEVAREPLRAVRRKTAQHLSAAWSTVPHVTQFDAADITALEELRNKYGKQVEASGGNLTVTAIAVKVVAAALKVFPQFNASIDLAGETLILKKYVHIGIAVDTDRGLLVPVIRDADQKNIVQIAVELSQVSEKARNRKISAEEMQGGCFSISNLGGIGGTYFTPIVNAPEVAILGISRAKWQPVYADRDRSAESGDQVHFVPRLMLPLSLSYDHRVIDGADGIRFLRWVAEALEQPFLLALHG